MTIGIYALTWDGTDKVYIGLSSRIEERFTAHLYTLKSGTHDNYKVQEAYHVYGLPKLVILEECLVSELNDKEVYWIDDFNSINNGFNIIEGGGHSYGCNHTTSKYSRIQILKSFILLAKTDLSYTNISKRTKVSKGIIAHIAQGISHTWLKELSSSMYTLATRDRSQIVKNNRAISRVGIGNSKYTYTFTSPEGITYFNKCITTFIKMIGAFNNISAAKQGFSKIIHGTKQDYFGWTCTREHV